MDTLNTFQDTDRSGIQTFKGGNFKFWPMSRKYPDLQKDYS